MNRYSIENSFKRIQRLQTLSVIGAIVFVVLMAAIVIRGCHKAEEMWSQAYDECAEQCYPMAPDIMSGGCLCDDSKKQPEVEK